MRPRLPMPLRRASGSLALAAAAAGFAAAGVPPEGEPVLANGALRTRVDERDAALQVTLADGTFLARLPIGLALRPEWPPRLLAPRSADDVRLSFRERGGPLAPAPALETVTAILRPAVGEDASAWEDGATAAVTAHAGAYGPVLHYTLPAGIFAGLRPAANASSPQGVAPAFGRSAAGGPLIVGGVPRAGGISLAAPARIVLDLQRALPGAKPGSLRLRGALAVDDASAAGAVLGATLAADGAVLLRLDEVTAAGGPAAFDVALPPARELTWNLTAEGSAAPAHAALLDLRIEGGGSTLSLEDVLRSARPGVDLLAGSGHEGGPLRLDLAPGYHPAELAAPAQSLLRAAQDAARTEPGAPPLTPLPLVFAFERQDGPPEARWLGAALLLLPPSIRASLQDGRVALGLPSELLAGGAGGTVTLSMALLVAKSREELLARYRELAELHGAAPPVAQTIALDRPEWWRRPLAFLRPPAGTSGAAQWSDAALGRDARALAAALGDPSDSPYTLVVDGRWAELPGDARPAPEFEALATFVADEHLRGRRVLLRFEPFATHPDSLAAAAGVDAGGALDGTFVAGTQAYFREFARRTLTAEIGCLNADGLLVAGLEHVRDPAAGANYRNLGAGVGWRELHRVLQLLQLEATRAKADALVLAPVAAPEFADDVGAVFLPRFARAPAVGTALLELGALLPDVPVYLGPEGGLAELPALGGLAVPSFDVRELLALPAPEALAWGAWLRVRAKAPLSAAARLSPRRAGVVHGSQVFAETIGNALVVRPRGGEAFAASLDGESFALPADLAGARIVAVMRNGQSVPQDVAGVQIEEGRLVGLEPGLEVRLAVAAGK